MHVSILILTLALALGTLTSPHALHYNERRDLSVTSISRQQSVCGPQAPANPSRKAARASTRNQPIIQLGSGWKLRLKRTASFLPIPLAASALSNFYQDIMMFALQAADAAEDELMSLTIQVGHMFLDFIATEQLSPVSWELVHDVAWAMLEMTNRGFTEGYHAVVKNGNSMVIVRIGLKAFDIAPAARAH